MIGVICNPPKQGEPSYIEFLKEKSAVLADLAEKAKLTTETLNSLDGVTCNAVQGAMYAFPQIRLPKRAIEVAKVSFFVFSVWLTLASRAPGYLT